MKDLRQIRDEVAKCYKEHDFYSCYVKGYVSESMIDQIAIRYAQEQNKELVDFAKSIVNDYENGLIDDIENVAIRAEQLIYKNKGGN